MTTSMTIFFNIFRVSDETWIFYGVSSLACSTSLPYDGPPPFEVDLRPLVRCTMAPPGVSINMQDAFGKEGRSAQLASHLFSSVPRFTNLFSAPSLVMAYNVLIKTER